MVLLAVSDTATFVMWSVNLVITIAVGVFMTLGLRGLDARTRKIESLETDLKKTAKDLVTAEIGLQTKSLQGSIDRLTEQMTGVRERLRDGDNELEKLGERGQKFELALRGQTSEIKDWMNDKFAGKAEMQLLCTRFDALAQHLHGLEIESVKAAVMASAGKKGGA